MYEEQLRRKPKHLGSKQRFVAYCPSFPALYKHPQLLGGTKLLQGMFDRGAQEALLLAKSTAAQEAEAAAEAAAAAALLSEAGAGRKHSFVDSILHKVLDAPATKITSFMLMNRYVCV